MKLKPCPFCGGVDFFVTFGTEDREGTPAAITCEECGSYGPWKYMEKQDISKIFIVAEKTDWNRRTDPVKAQMLKALKVASKNLHYESVLPYELSSAITIVDEAIKAVEEE